MNLTELDRAVLDFERQWWAHRGGREQAVRDRFGVTMTAHLQRVNRLLDHPAAAAYSPVTVARLRRLRAR